MTVAEIRSEAESLSVKDRAALVAFLVELNEEEDPAYLQRITDEIDDRSPENWVRLADLDRALES